MKFYLISDTHFKHDKMETYCQREPEFSAVILRNCQNVLSADTTLIHLGDVGIGAAAAWKPMIRQIPGRKILIRGNHDRNRSLPWWCDHGFDFACDSMMFRGWWLTHEPADVLPSGAAGNIHGHLHNIWSGFSYQGTDIIDVFTGKPFPPPTSLKHDWQRLFAVEYTDLMPVEFDKFVSHPDKYQARGPRC
jgi:calcineurin-like phosphoesterase family protein